MALPFKAVRADVDYEEKRVEEDNNELLKYSVQGIAHRRLEMYEALSCQSGIRFELQKSYKEQRKLGKYFSSQCQAEKKKRKRTKKVLKDQDIVK